MTIYRLGLLLHFVLLIKKNLLSLFMTGKQRIHLFASGKSVDVRCIIKSVCPTLRFFGFYLYLCGKI